MRVWLVCAMALMLTLSACASIGRPAPQVVVGRILLSDRLAATPFLGGILQPVYEVRALEAPDVPMFLIALVECPFDLDHPERNDPGQLYRIEYESSRRRYELYDAPHSDFITTKCEKA